MRTLIRYGCSVIILFATVVVVATAMKVAITRQYSLAAQRINAKIAALESLRPEGISHELWMESVAAVSIAFVNICFSESHASYDEMLRFEAELDVKLAGLINLDFIEWMWGRLSTISPHASEYVARWKLNWEEHVRADAERRQKVLQTEIQTDAR